MSEDLHNIDDLFREGLKNNADQPSESVWENIDKSLDKKKVISISKKYSKLKWAVAVLLLFSIGMAMYSVYVSRQNKDLVRQKNQNSIIEKSETSLGSDKEKTNNTAEKKQGPTPKDSVSNEKQQQDNIAASNSNNDSLSRNKENIKEKIPGENNTPGNLIVENHTSHVRGNGSELHKQNQLTVKNNNHLTTRQNYQENDGSDKENLSNATLNVQKNTSSGNDEVEKQIEKNIHEKETYVSGIEINNDFEKYFKNLVIEPQPSLQIFDIDNAELQKNNTVLKTKTHNEKSRLTFPLSATLFFSPDFVTTNLKDDHPRFREDNRHEIKENERTQLSSTVGALVSFNATKNWILESGVTFSKNIIDMDPKTIYARPDDDGNINYRINCSAGYSFLSDNLNNSPRSGDSIKTLSSANTLQYIGIPFLVKYKLTRRKLSLGPAIGVSANFLTKGKIETTLPVSNGTKSTSSGKIEGLKSSYFQGLMSFGIEYSLSKTFAITFTPSARFGLTSINNNTPVKTKLNTYGLAAGLSFKF